MSDEGIASIARDLAQALTDRAHSRSTDDSKRVAILQTELVAACVAEQRRDEQLASGETQT